MFMKVSCLETRPVRGTLGRHASVCKVQAIWNPMGNSSRSKSYPPLTYSINRQDISGAELGMLLAVSHTDAMVGPEAIPLCLQNYSYWRSPAGLRHTAKLEVALRRSVATVACFTTWDVYGEAAAAAGCGSGAAEAAVRDHFQDAAAAEDASPLLSASAYRQHRNCHQNNSQDYCRDHNHHQQQHQQVRSSRMMWQQQEEECSLTAARHQRGKERELRSQWGSRSYGFGARVGAAAAAGAVERGEMVMTTNTDDGPGRGAAAAASSSSSSSSPRLWGSSISTGDLSQQTDGAWLSSNSSSSPPPSRTAAAASPPYPYLFSQFSSSTSTSSLSSSPSSTSAQPTTRLGTYGSKPPTPSGVPDMDWNWLLPFGKNSSSSDGRNSGSCSSCSSSHDSSSISSRSSGRFFKGGSPGDGNGSGGGNAWTSSAATASPPPAPPQQPSWQWRVPGSSSSTSSTTRAPRRSLVGFARATGDNNLMATIYDVAVHPAIRGQGIGRRLVKLLVQQIQARSVYDIGVVTPTAAVGFWERCSFGDDREGSTFMTFMGRSQRLVGHPSGRHPARDPDYLSDRPGWQAGEALERAELHDINHDDDGSGFGAPYSSQELLQRANHLGHWDAAARSESLRALLAEKLHRLREAPVAWEGRAGDGRGGLRVASASAASASADGHVRWGAARSRDGGGGGGSVAARSSHSE